MTPMGSPVQTSARSSAAVDEFSLRRVVRGIVADLGPTDVAAICDAVVEAVPETMLRDALAQALVPLVRDVASEHRPRGPIARPQAPAPSFRPAAVPPPGPSAGSPAAPPAGSQPAQVTGGGAPSRRLSGGRKGAEIRDAWQRVLEAPYSTPAGSKRLGDCTYEDLYYMAQQLDVLAERNRARARGFRELAALLTDHEATTVRDLPAEVLMQSLGAAS